MLGDRDVAFCLPRSSSASVAGRGMASQVKDRFDEQNCGEMTVPTSLHKTRRRMARERRGAGSSLVSMETQFYKQYMKDVL